MDKNNEIDQDSMNKGQYDKLNDKNLSISQKPISNTSDNELNGTNIDLDDEACTFNKLFAMCGDGGFWQLRTGLILLYSSALSGLHNIAYAFIGAVPDYNCIIKGLSLIEVQNISANINIHGKNTLDQCKHYLVKYFANGSVYSIDKNIVVKCRNFRFDASIFEKTIPSEWSLVCDKAHLGTSIQGIFMLGVLVGSLLFGTTSDKYGRKNIIVISTLLFAISSPLVGLSSNYIMAIVMRFAVGMAEPGLYGTSFVLLIEILGPKWREIGGTIFNIPYALGYMALAGFGYYLRNWRHLQYGISAPIVIQLLLLFFIPESPRWLIKKARFDEAEKLIIQIAKSNKKTLPTNFRQLLEKVTHENIHENENETFWYRLKLFFIEWIDLFRTPKIRIRTLVLYFSWISVSMVYYGVALIMPKSEDPFLYVLIGGALEIPSTFMVLPLIRYVGRRFSFAGFFIITGAALLFTLLFKEGSPGIIALAHTGKATIAAAFVLIYVYAAEMFPTLIRATAIGTASMVGHLGSIISPYILNVFGDSNKSTELAMIIFGTLSLLTGFLALLLPETANKKMPETIQDVESRPMIAIKF